MRRAMPYPCKGPVASRVFKAMRARVPCQTLDFSPIWLSHMSMDPMIADCKSGLALYWRLLFAKGVIRMGSATGADIIRVGQVQIRFRLEKQQTGGSLT